MYKAETGQMGQTFADFNEAVAYATSGAWGRVVDSDGVHMRAEWVFSNGAMTKARVNVNGQMQTADRAT